jgi:hypothetical protein
LNFSAIVAIRGNAPELCRFAAPRFLVRSPRLDLPSTWEPFFALRDFVQVVPIGHEIALLVLGMTIGEEFSG